VELQNALMSLSGQMIRKDEVPKKKKKKKKPNDGLMNGAQFLQPHSAHQFAGHAEEPSLDKKRKLEGNSNGNNSSSKSLNVHASPLSLQPQHLQQPPMGYLGNSAQQGGYGSANNLYNSLVQASYQQQG
jgi:hypothetical protein